MRNIPCPLPKKALLVLLFLQPTTILTIFAFFAQQSRWYLFRDHYVARWTANIVLVGASWAGIWNLHLLQKLGLQVLLIDACEDLGDTWYSSRYPGCHVGTEIPLYEFSDPDLWKNWTQSKFIQEAESHERSMSWSVPVYRGSTYRTALDRRPSPTSQCPGRREM
jgi:hypothetical protein